MLQFLEDDVDNLKRFKRCADENALQRWGFKYCPAKEIMQVLEREKKFLSNSIPASGGSRSETSSGKVAEISKGNFVQFYFNKDILPF